MKNDGWFTQVWWTDETVAMSPHGTLEHSSRSKIKDVFFVYLCISLMRYETAMWMEWDQFTSSVWRVVSIDFFPLFYVPLQETFYRFRESNWFKKKKKKIQINTLLASPLLLPNVIATQLHTCFRTGFLNIHSYHWTDR